MTTTQLTHSYLGRARTGLGLAAVPAHACAPIGVTTAITTAMTTEMNLWLGGDVQVPGFGSTSATKRIAPGRLEGMT